MFKETYDLVIAGGGLVGASLAIALRDTDLKIALCDAGLPRDTYKQTFDGRNIALAPSSEKIFTELGVWEKINALACQIQHIHVSQAGSMGISRLHAKDVKRDALGYVIAADDLAVVLHQQLTTINNVDCFWGARIEALTKNDQEQHILHAVHGDKPLELTAKLLVAADGANSVLRDCELIAKREYNYQQVALVCNIGLARDHENIAFERFTKTGPIAMLPLTRQRAALIWTLQQQQVTELLVMDEQQFLQQVQTTFGYRLGKFVKVGKRFSFPLIAKIAEETIKPGFVLLGNAAHFLHPAAGQGFNLSLRDVNTLVDVIRGALANKQAINDTEILKHYQALRNIDQNLTAYATDSLVRLFDIADPIIGIGRSIGLRAFDKIPELKRSLLRRAMGEVDT